MNKLDKLLDEPGIWRAGERRQETGLEHVTTGFPALDAALPGGGWPLGALTEIVHAQTGIGELSLFMPALAELSRQSRWIALIAPPYLPYAPALTGHGVDLSRLLLIHPGNATEALWAVEQVLRSGTCAAALAWPRRADTKSLRRLQLAAATGRSLGLLFRAHASGTRSSPAALRLRLEHREDRALIKLLKCRGARAGQELTVDLPRSDHSAKRPAPPAEPAVAKLPQRSATPLRPLRSNRRATTQRDLPLAPAPRPPRR